jgi:hypothetical protein
MKMQDAPDWVREYLAIPLIALFAGMTRYLGRIRAGHRFGWIDFAAEMSACILAGVVGGLICQGMGLPQPWQWAVAALSGHMGGRSIGLLQDWLRRKLED